MVSHMIILDNICKPKAYAQSITVAFGDHQQQSPVIYARESCIFLHHFSISTISRSSNPVDDQFVRLHLRQA